MFTDKSLGSPTAWNWDFGDGTTSNDQNPTHTFTYAAVYDVRLTVTRGSDTATSIQSLNVGGIPLADFTGSSRLVGVGDPVQFTDMSSNSPTRWTWDFGDTATSENQNPGHSYQLKGSYTVSLTAQNANGRDTETKTGYINVGLAPTAGFYPVIAPYVVGKVPMAVSFVDTSVNLPTSWTWDFGDGTTSTDQNPGHVYQTAGVYTVTQTVTNIFGSDTLVRKDFITVGQGGVVDFTASATTVGVGRIVTFTDHSTNAPTQWTWEFGDGTVASGEKPDHVYRATGVYDVSLTASSPSITGSITKTKYITVLNLPRADFVADKTRGGAPMTVTFTDKTVNTPTSWNWDFGDGATSFDQNPVHTYTTLGSYSVTLTATNADGKDSTTKVNYIVTTLAPVASFSADRQLGKAPFVVQFTDLSSNSPASWNWDFGDGTASSEQNPRHIYQQEGSYNVSLTATNQYGSDTSFKSGSSGTATSAGVTSFVTAPPVTSAPAMTQNPAAAGVTTAIPATTRASLPAAVSVIASIIAVLAIVSARQK
ncbi:MAG: PKD domain-containing protein [Methanoregula sp.]|nr:PKD domain-containing protein [Methanoregula sp.]